MNSITQNHQDEELLSKNLAQAHCIKDSVLLDETCGSGGFMARAKNNSEVIWSEQRSV